jgi:hypothetical protein
MKSFKPTHVAIAAALVCAAAPVLAIDFKLGEFDAKLTGTATIGTMIRMDDPSPDVLTYVNSQVVGLPAGKLVGTSGASNMNFEKNKPVSTVLKGMFDLDIHGKDVGLFMRAYGWTDTELTNGSRAYGNFPNGYQAGSALSDNGFAPEAKFSNLLLRDVYLYGSFKPADGTEVKARLGRQTLDWGKALLIGGGINAAITSQDLAASLRPGALPEEGKLPTAMLSASLAAGKNWGADGFIKLENRSPVFPGCGTFFDMASLLPPGCNLAAANGNPSPFPAALGSPLTTVASLSEPALFKSGHYVHRGADVNPRDDGQWGVSLRYLAESVNTEFRGYAMNTSSTTPGFRVYTPTVALATSAPINLVPLPAAQRPVGAVFNYAFNALTDPNGLKYGVSYANDVQLFGLAFDSKPAPGSRIYGEFAVRPNAQLNWNGNDLLTAALQPLVANAALNISKGLGTLPMGSAYDAFDRLRVTTAMLGGNQVLPNVLGAERMIVVAELGLSHVDNLPDANVLRYGRSFPYGTAPSVQLNGTMSTCSEAIQANGIPAGVAGKTCTTDGFVSTDAVGLRLNVMARYPNALMGATLVPSLYIAKDISGYSYDGTYSQGRMPLRPSLRAEWGKYYYLDVAYTRFSGGDYNLMTDHSNLTLVAGVKF